MNPLHTIKCLEDALAERFGGGRGDVVVRIKDDEVRVVVDGCHGRVDMTVTLAPGRDLTHVAALLGVTI